MMLLPYFQIKAKENYYLNHTKPTLKNNEAYDNLTAIPTFESVDDLYT
jgi:hypothetical protein